MSFRETCSEWSKYRSVRKSHICKGDVPDGADFVAETEIDGHRVIVYDKHNDYGLVARILEPGCSTGPSYYIETLLGEDGYAHDIRRGGGLCTYYCASNPEESRVIPPMIATEIGEWLDDVRAEYNSIHKSIRKSDGTIEFTISVSDIGHGFIDITDKCNGGFFDNCQSVEATIDWNNEWGCFEVGINAVLWNDEDERAPGKCCYYDEKVYCDKDTDIIDCGCVMTDSEDDYGDEYYYDILIHINR